jgi:hypothetical protein
LVSASTQQSSEWTSPHHTNNLGLSTAPPFFYLIRTPSSQATSICTLNLLPGLLNPSVFFNNQSSARLGSLDLEQVSRTISKTWLMLHTWKYHFTVGTQLMSWALQCGPGLSFSPLLPHHCSHSGHTNPHAMSWTVYSLYFSVSIMLFFSAQIFLPFTSPSSNLCARLKKAER